MISLSKSLLLILKLSMAVQHIGGGQISSSKRDLSGLDYQMFLEKSKPGPGYYNINEGPGTFGFGIGGGVISTSVKASYITGNLLKDPCC